MKLYETGIKYFVLYAVLSFTSEHNIVCFETTIAFLRNSKITKESEFI